MMLRWWLILMSLCSVSTVQIGKISYAIYTPQPTSINASFMLQFSMSCDECLCYAIRSNRSYSIINCIENTRQCLFYTNYSANYNIYSNNNVSVYLFQFPSVPPIAITSVAPASTHSTPSATTETLLSNVWILLGNMTVARMRHTSTYMPETDNVLIAGGVGLASMEIFVPSNKSFIKTVDMSQVRYGYSAEYFGEHLIFLAGNTTADFYDPGARTINKTINTSTLRVTFSSSITKVNGSTNVLLIGGDTALGLTNFLSTVDIYNNGTETFHLKTMSSARFYHTSTTLPNGNILIAGGASIGYNILNTLEMYNSSSNSFVNLTVKMSGPHYYHTATYIPSIQSILFAGGSYSTISNWNTYELFNVTTFQFVRNGTMLYERSAHTATLLNNGKVLLVGNDPALQAVEVFDPITFTCYSAGNLSVARGYHTATLLSNSNQVLVCGGKGTSGTLNSCEIYYS